MALDDRTEAWARLALVSLPAAAILPLLRAFDTPQGVLGASHAALAAVSSKAMASRVLASPDADAMARTRAWLSQPGHELIAWDDPDYPPALLQTQDAPPVLFYIGLRAVLAQPAVAIVGSRHATPQGLENARNFATALSRAGLAIVSGLALGIDGAAHEGALEGSGSTIACIGTGPDRVYPAAHRDLAHRIAKAGGIVSEFIPGTPPLRYNFPRRNRLISGLSKGVLVVEATLQSGSLITARLAGDQGREVLAIPGSIHSPFSRGCHRLIRDGAKLVETAQDVLVELDIAGIAPTASTVDGAGAPLSTPHASIVAALGGDPCGVDTLVERTRLDVDALGAALVELELEGLVASLPGGRWQRVTGG